MKGGANYNLTGTELGDFVYGFTILKRFYSEITQNLFPLVSGGDNELGERNRVTACVFDELVWFSTLC